MGSNTSSSRSALAVLLAVALLLVWPGRATTQTDVRIGVKASGTLKSPMLLERFRAGAGAESDARNAHDIVRHDFDLSGVFAIADVDPLTEKLTPNPAEQGTVRLQGYSAVGPYSFA